MAEPIKARQIPELSWLTVPVFVQEQQEDGTHLCEALLPAGVPSNCSVNEANSVLTMELVQCTPFLTLENKVVSISSEKFAGM